MTPIYTATLADHPECADALAAAEAAVEHERAAVVMSGFAAAFVGFWPVGATEAGAA